MSVPLPHSRNILFIAKELKIGSYFLLVPGRCPLPACLTSADAFEASAARLTASPLEAICLFLAAFRSILIVFDFTMLSLRVHFFFLFPLPTGLPSPIYDEAGIGNGSENFHSERK